VRFYPLVRRERTSNTGWLAVAATALVAGIICGCGGGGSKSKVVYAVGPDSPNVAIFAVSGSGELAPVGSPVSTGSAPDAIAIDPAHRFAYIVDSTNGIGPGGVSQYILDPKSGNLAVATFSATNGTTPPATPAETGTNPVAIVIDDTGTFVFVANQGSDSISVFIIDEIGCSGVCGNGTLTEIKQPAPGPIPPNCVLNSPVPCPLSIVPASPTALATSGKMLFVATSNAGAGSVSTYAFDSTTGVVTTPAAFTTAVDLNPSAMTMDASGKFLFLTDSGASEVEVLSIGSSGQLTPVSQSAPCAVHTCATGPTPLNVWVHPSGKFLYTANQGSTVNGTSCVNGGVSAFSIDGSGALTQLSGSPFAAGPCPSYAATDSSGGFLFVANAGNNNTISVFTIDSTGALKQEGSPSPSIVINPVALASIN